jgi:hypothetical protein
VNAPTSQGRSVRAVDVKRLYEWHQINPAAESEVADLSRPDKAFRVADGGRVVYSLAYPTSPEHGTRTGGCEKAPAAISRKVALAASTGDHPPTPQGVRGRRSDKAEIQKRYGWAPSTALTDGMKRTYRWVYDELKKSLG